MKSNKTKTVTQSLIGKTLVGLILFFEAVVLAKPILFKDTVVIDTNQIIRNENLSSKAKAESLAQMAEILVSPTGFMFADAIFDKALRLDRTNQRAQFYKAMLGPFMVLEGILKRVEPLFKNETYKQRVEYEKYAKRIYPNSGLQAFLLNGNPDIKNEADIQRYLDRLGAAQDKFRQFLKTNKDLELTLNVSRVKKLKPTVRQEIWEKCFTRELSKGVFVVSPCKVISQQRFKIERADVEVLQHIASGLQLFTIIATSYDAKGVLAYNRKNRKGSFFSDQDIVDYFGNIGDFGKLRASNNLGLVKKMGSDIYSGAKWATKMQYSLCPRGTSVRNPQTPNSYNRQGYMIKNGICINDIEVDDLYVFADAKLITSTNGEKGKKVFQEYLGKDGYYDPAFSRIVLRKVNNSNDELILNLKTGHISFFKQ